MTHKIRNFCIIAHIDHGKSTLADRLLESTETVSKREMKAQLLDQMDLERERGITIKLQPVRMEYRGHVLNLIDTPGHVDFTYEVSRSLAAVEGALLLVDATQGIQAQTLANLYLALEQNLTIIPVINKIDLPNAQIEKTTQEMISLLGVTKEEILLCSGKTGAGVPDILNAVIERVPPPESVNESALKALIFDSFYDDYQGVIAYIRIFAGQIKPGENLHFLSTKAAGEALETGVFRPGRQKTQGLATGEIGYLVTGLKEVAGCQVGDTISTAEDTAPLPGYRQLTPMVFAGIFCKEGNDFQFLREALGRLKLSDSSLQFEPEHSPALGYGFRCGFLGLLHMEIIQERLKREFDLDLIFTVPSAAYKVILKQGIKEINTVVKGEVVKKTEVKEPEFILSNPLELPDSSIVDHIEEPFVKVDIIAPDTYQGAIMQLVAEKRGIYKNTEYLQNIAGQAARVILHYEMPLTAIIVDFYDKLKSVSSGYATLNYELLGYRSADVARLDILVAEEQVEALASIHYRDEAYEQGKKIVKKLREILPRQMFEVKIQAAIGSKIIASEKLPAMRKDVTAKLYGGDVTRKRKLLEKQKKGKKKMKEFGIGKVDIPAAAYLAIFKI